MISNVAQSVHQRLLNLARARPSFQELLQTTPWRLFSTASAIALR